MLNLIEKLMKERQSAENQYDYNPETQEYSPKSKNLPLNLKKGGAVNSGYKKAADGCVTKGKTKGRFV
jgi:hypothetical protein